jgi:putative Ca2+/H+ antiporter (TMEM165/GDT1 family)
VDLLVVGLAFAAIFVVELPDKTFIATLVLSTKFRPLLVWIGVGMAFTLQTAIAVGLGSAISLLPLTWVRVGAAVLFLVGALLLFREARHADEEEPEAEEEYAERAGHYEGSGAWKAVLASFLVLFAAEWGDLSQLLTLSLVAKYDEPLSVFVGALAALLAVSGLAVIAGRTLMRFVKLYVLFYAGAAVCLLLEALVLWELFGPGSA